MNKQIIRKIIRKGEEKEGERARQGRKGTSGQEGRRNEKE